MPNRRNEIKKKDIIAQYIFYTNVAVAAMVFLVPIGAWLITGNETYLSPVHFLLAGFVGAAQVFVNYLYRQRFREYWVKVRNSIKSLADKLSNIRRLEDIRNLREEKENLLYPLLEEKSFSTLGESLDGLLEKVLDVMEIKLFKEDLIKKLTSTLDTDRLANILLNNLIRYYDIPAAAIYLKSPYDDDFELKVNKGFGEIKNTLDESFLSLLQDKEDVLIEEPVKLPLDLGICELPTQRLFVHKLVPRKRKLIGVLFFGFREVDENSISKLREFLEETRTTLALIFENALEHERSLSLANLDPLTGVYNRREGFKLIKKLLSRSSVEGENVCLLLMDIDHFKRINDTYGHEAGDKVLKEVVKAVREVLREDDIVVRWGGEEFLIALHGVSPEEAVEIAERIRLAVASKSVKVRKNSTLGVTVSIGVACSKAEGTYSFDKLFELADLRLYRAKREGRNRVVAS